VLYRFQTTAIKEKKKAYLDGGNDTTVVEMSSKATMEATNSNDTTQTKEDEVQWRMNKTKREGF